MKIVLNNRDQKIEGFNEITVRELFREMKFSFPNIIVKINHQLIKKSEFDDAVIKDGDNVNAIHMISGG